MFAFFKYLCDLCSRPILAQMSDGANSRRYRLHSNLLRPVVSVRCDYLPLGASVGQDLSFYCILTLCPTLKKAGNLLPSSCPELEQFIKAQAHIRAAVRFTDDLTIVEPPQLPKEQQGFSTTWPVKSPVCSLRPTNTSRTPCRPSSFPSFPSKKSSL